VESSLNLESGTWTPTFDGADGACSNPISSLAMYSKVGNIVTCTIYGTVGLDFTSTSEGHFTTSLPIGTSGNSTRGIANYETKYNVNGFVYNDKINFSSDLTTDISENGFYVIFQYEID
jgi:hypothetical protein